MTPTQRHAIDDALSIAHAARRMAREGWAEALIAAMADLGQTDAQAQQVRALLEAANTAYANAMDAVDHQLIDRVSAIILNEQVERAELADRVDALTQAQATSEEARHRHE